LNHSWRDNSEYLCIYQS